MSGFADITKICQTGKEIRNMWFGELKFNEHCWGFDKLGSILNDKT